VVAGAGGAPLAGAVGTAGALVALAAGDVGPWIAAWTAMRPRTGVRTAVMAGVTADTPAQHNVVATAVVRPHTAHGRSRWLTGTV
jgi:hypothetical protein